MQEIDTRFNIHNPESPLYAFNNMGTPVSDPEIIHVVKSALQICHETGGAFDITISPLSDLWGFYNDSPKPTQYHIPGLPAIIGRWLQPPIPTPAPHSPVDSAARSGRGRLLAARPCGE